MTGSCFAGLSGVRPRKLSSTITSSPTNLNVSRQLARVFGLGADSVKAVLGLVSGDLHGGPPEWLDDFFVQSTMASFFLSLPGKFI